MYTLPYTRFVHFHTGYFLVAGLQVISGLTAITAITSHTTHEETRRLLPLHLQGSVSALVFFCFLFTALILTSALSLPSFIINITRKELRAYRADEHTLRAACTAIYWLCYISVAVLFSSAGLAWYLLQNITEVYRLPRSAGMQTPINMFARGSLGTDKPKARGLLMYWTYCFLKSLLRYSFHTSE